jgi:hydroxyacylglutathione hydrolase
MRLITLPVGELETNCYILFEENRDEALVVDPGAEGGKILEALDGRKVAAVLLTHGHFDHTGALSDFSDTPIYIHQLDSMMLQDSHYSFGRIANDHTPRPAATNFLTDGQCLALAGMKLQMLHTPGHTRGSVCLRIGDDILTGDTLFKNDYGRTDLPGGSEAQMRASLRRLLSLSGLRFHPGHGDGGVIK